MALVRSLLAAAGAPPRCSRSRIRDCPGSLLSFHARRPRAHGFPFPLPFPQPALAPEPFLEPFHAPIVPLVIVTQQVQQTMEREHPQLGQLGVAAGARTSTRHTSRDGNI